MTNVDKNTAGLQDKLNAFEVEELESRLEMAAWIEVNSGCYPPPIEPQA